MIVLDTDVLSNPLKPVSDPVMPAWLNRQVRRELFVTTIRFAEWRAGLALLPAGSAAAATFKRST